MQRREPVEPGRSVASEDPLEGGKHAAVEGDAIGQLGIHLDPAVPGDEGGGRPTADEREPAPAPAVVNGFEQETRVIAHDAQER